MATSGKYGKLDIPGIGDNEPVFILRAQDKLAADAIKLYHTLVSSHDCDLSFLHGISGEYIRFCKWSGYTKLPD